MPPNKAGHETADGKLAKVEEGLEQLLNEVERGLLQRIYDIEARVRRFEKLRDYAFDRELEYRLQRKLPPPYSPFEPEDATMAHCLHRMRQTGRPTV